jgi:anti-anti-sigma factor
MSQIDVSQQDGTLTITVPARFDSHIIENFRNAYTDIPSDADLLYVIDLAQTEYIDSSALGMLLNFKHHVQAGDHIVCIKNCKPKLKHIFEMSSFTSMFKFL